MSALAIPRLTPEQYLEIERAAEFKSEYLDGQMYAMSGGTLPHSVLALQLGSAVREALRGKGCKAATSDLRVRVSPQGPFFYPDLTVYCGAPALGDDYRDMLLNPIVVFEIVSKSSEGYDRGEKFAQYRKIESLREYVVVSQTKPSIDTFFRQADGKWLLTEFSGSDAVCRLESIDCAIALADVYDGVEF